MRRDTTAAICHLPFVVVVVAVVAAAAAGDGDGGGGGSGVLLYCHFYRNYC